MCFNLLQLRYEEANPLDVRDFLDELPNVVEEQTRVVVDNQVQVDALPSKRVQHFRVFQTARTKIKCQSYYFEVLQVYF